MIDEDEGRQAGSAVSDCGQFLKWFEEVEKEKDWSFSRSSVLSV